MSWVTVIWSMVASACLTLAAIHLLVWSRKRQAWANFLFAITAVATAAYAFFELWRLLSKTPVEYGTALRWGHVPMWLLIVSLVGFVRLYLRAGRPWLAWTICALRTVSLLLNFVTGESINFRHISSLHQIPFLGESIPVPQGSLNPWMLVGQASVILLVIFVVDATVTVWRRGDRNKALAVGGSIVFFVVSGLVQTVLLLWAGRQMPVTISLFYMGIVVAMTYEMSGEMLRSAKLSEELGAREQRLDLAASGGGLGLWMWDIARDQVWINEKGRSLFGFDPSDILDIEHFRSRVHPEDRDLVRAAAENSIRDGTEYDTEYRIVLPDKNVRWIHGHGRVELGVDGKPWRVHGVSMDITDRKMTEEALRESELRFRTMANTAPVMIWMAGADKLCTFFNKGWLDFTGRPLEKELGNGWAEGVHRDDFKRCLYAYVQSFDARQPFTMEYRLRRHDGEYRWITDNGVPRYDPDGNFVGYIGTCVDLTERKRAEEKLAQLSERNELILNSAAEGILGLDLQGNHTFVNAAAARMLGYEMEELLGRHSHSMWHHSRSDGSHYPKEECKIYAAYRDGKVHSASTEVFWRKDGTSFPVEYSSTPVFDKGELVGAVVTFEDITTRKQAELEAQRHRTELTHLGRVALMGEMAASLAHEVNQPLAAIVSNADAGQRFIDRGKVDLSEIRELLDDISADGRRASEVVRGIRGMVKKSETIREQINFNELVMNVVAIVQPDATLRFCEVRTSLAADLPPIQGNAVQLRQVLLNLVVNGFDAMQDTPIGQRIVEITTARENDKIRTSVCDHGGGISEETRQRLFEPYFTTKEHGLGMGLTIVRSIVESHGGSIGAENVDGAGACFYFTVAIG